MDHKLALSSTVEQVPIPDGIRAPYCFGCGACLIPVIAAEVGHAVILRDGSLWCMRCTSPKDRPPQRAETPVRHETEERS